MAKTELSDTDYAALSNFRYMLRQFMAFSEARAEEQGLTPQQHQALLTIRAAPAGHATIGYVAERLLLKPHSASGMVDRLELAGLVRRTASQSDKRQFLLALTRKATAILTKLSAAHKEELARLQPMLMKQLLELKE